MCGLDIISPAARFGKVANSGTLVNGLAKIRAAREYDWAYLCSHSRMGGKAHENVNGM